MISKMGSGGWHSHLRDEHNTCPSIARPPSFRAQKHIVSEDATPAHSTVHVRGLFM